MAERASADPVWDPMLLEDPNLWVRQGDNLVRAPAGDLAVAKSYRDAQKGPLSASGERLTLLTAKTKYAVGEEIRVLHVHEVTVAGMEILAAGPKPIFGETVEGKPVTPVEYEFTIYDSIVDPSPYLDFNYEITSYRLEAGRHVLRWKSRVDPDGPVLTSNEIVVEVH